MNDRRRQTRRPRKEQPARPSLHLEDAVVRELKEMARPGKGEILVKVFAEAAGAFSEEDFATAIELGEQAKHIALRSPVIRELLGLIYYRAGRWSEAARELAAFRRLSGSSEQNPVLADCYRALKKPQKALELCDEVPPSVAPAVFYEAAIVGAAALADMGRVGDVGVEVAQEHHLRVWYVLADLLQRRGRFTQAREWFDAVAAVDADLTDAPERAAKLRATR